MLKKCLFFISIISICAVFFAGSGLCAGEEPYSHLSRAIDLYNEGRYDESFDELTAQIEQNRFCALAYYYRARIRVAKEKYRLAAVSLKAAFRDSADFTDAVGLHAYILKKQGKIEEALNEWRRFVEDSGITEEDITVDSIMLPEEYHEKLERIQKEEFETRLREQAASVDSQKLRTSETPLPMSVVDFIEREKGAVTEEDEAAEETTGYGHFLFRIKYLLIIPAGIVLFSFFLKLRGFYVRPRVKAVKEACAPEEATVIRQPAEKESITISNGIHKDSEYLPGDFYEEAMRLKEEREKHAGEIERLLKKI